MGAAFGCPGSLETALSRVTEKVGWVAPFGTLFRHEILRPEWPVVGRFNRQP